MPWYPGATRRPIDWLGGLSRGGVTPTAVVLHVTASEAASQYGYFSGQRNAGSHFHVARDGTIEQYADTAARSAADYGSKRTISVETQGGADGPWTAAQAESLARLIAWCHTVHGIPLRLMASSALAQHGIGWHRLGIDGNWPAGILGGRLQRDPSGEKWSGSRGKVCPGDDRIHQVPAILARAVAIVGAPTPTPAPTPPAPAGDDETEIILMPGYPFMFRADTQDGWTIALSPTRTVAVPVLKGDEGKALRALFGEPQIVGPEMARRLRETLR